MSAKNKTEVKNKRKGLGGLSPEKRKLLRQLIIQKAADELRKQKEMEAAEKNKVVESRVPKLQTSGLKKEELQSKVKELYNIVCELEEEKYDWELKIRKQEFEICQLNAEANNIKGHFVKPVLKKVSKTELAKFDSEKMKSRPSFDVTALRSTGQQKYAVDDKDNIAVKNQWRQNTPGKDSDAGDDDDDDDKQPKSFEPEAKGPSTNIQDNKVDGAVATAGKGEDEAVAATSETDNSDEDDDDHEKSKSATVQEVDKSDTVSGNVSGGCFAEVEDPCDDDNKNDDGIKKQDDEESDED